MVYEMLGTKRTEWAGKTSAEIIELARSDGSVLIVPVGSIEQHGHHLPVATDTILADAIAHVGADRIVADIPVTVTPPLWSGYSPHQLSFGGTLTVQHEHLLHTLEDVVGSALQNGFDAVLLLNGHGGNTPLINSATSTIGVDHPDVDVLGATYFELAAPFIDDVRESEVGGCAHGGEFETSLMLHLRRDLVREDRIEGEPLVEPYTHSLKDMFAGGPLGVYRPFDEYSENGAIGVPELATAEKGEELYTRLGDELAGILRELHTESRD
jgi:creatinine amidohydrolase